MPNSIKYSTTIPPNSLHKGNVALGVNNVDYGPTTTTGWYNGVTPTSGKYVIYKTAATGDPDVFAPQSDQELYNFVIMQGGGAGDITSTANALSWIATQSNLLTVPNVVDPTGLLLNLDASLAGSSPTTNENWYDMSGGENNGTLINGPTYNLSNGGSIDFDGTNDYMTLPSSMIPATTNWTYSCWFNADTLVAGGVLYCQYTSASGNGRILINLAEENFKPCIRLLSGPGYGSVVVFSNVIPTVGQYYNFVISRNSQTYNLYINGLLDTSYIAPFNANIQQTTPVIGGRSTSQASPTPASSNFFNGKIAITDIYDRALSDTEILQNFNAQKNRFGL